MQFCFSIGLTWADDDEESVVELPALPSFSAKDGFQIDKEAFARDRLAIYRDFAAIGCDMKRALEIAKDKHRNRT